MHTIIIKIESKQIKAFEVNQRHRLLNEWVFKGVKKTLPALNKQIKEVLKQIKQKGKPIILLDKNHKFFNNKKLYAQEVISFLEAQIKFEIMKGSFKKHGTYSVLQLDKDIRLTVVHHYENVLLDDVLLNDLVVNFNEALSQPHERYLAKDFCSENYFKLKMNRDYRTVYQATQEGSNNGAEAFVEFGANLGALIANLDLLFASQCTMIIGELADTFDAWSHSMGKSRNQHLHHKATTHVKHLVLNDHDLIVGASL